MKNRLPFENHLNRFKNSGLIQNNFKKVKIKIFIFFFQFSYLQILILYIISM